MFRICNDSNDLFWCFGFSIILVSLFFIVFDIGFIATAQILTLNLLFLGLGRIKITSEIIIKLKKHFPGNYE